MSNLITRARDFMEQRVHPWWQGVVCAWSPELRKRGAELLLAGIFLQLQKLREALQQGGTYFRITPFSLVANAQAIRILDIEVQGRVREVSIWMDSAIGLPDPVIRISTDASGSAGNGVRMAAGSANELGKVPANTTLYASADVNLNGYIIERG